MVLGAVTVAPDSGLPPNGGGSHHADSASTRGITTATHGLGWRAWQPQTGSERRLGGDPRTRRVRLGQRALPWAR
jgi:hypothetical protein